MGLTEDQREFASRMSQDAMTEATTRDYQRESAELLRQLSFRAGRPGRKDGRDTQEELYQMACNRRT